MGLPFALGAQKRWIMVTLWRLPPSQLSQPLTNTLCQTPFEQSAWLQGFFKHRSWQGLPPNSCYAAADIPKTLIITPLCSLFEYLFMAFGLSNAAQTFPRMMDPIVDGLEVVVAYMDDSHVGSPGRQIHLLHLEAFFYDLATIGLVINLEKCVFAVPTLELLGHTILATGSAPEASHAATI
jgi:hypothetical protein